MKPQLEKIPLDAFVRDFAQGLAPLARKHRVRLKASAREDIVVWADRGDLERAVRSLCKSAVSHAKSEVEIRAWVQEGRAILNVRGNGAGGGANYRCALPLAS